VTALERELQKVKTALKVATNATQKPWWEQHAGQFKNDPLFDLIVAMGQEYRRSKIPQSRKWSSTKLLNGIEIDSLTTLCSNFPKRNLNL
jgi:hypothetical protein